MKYLSSGRTQMHGSTDAFRAGWDAAFGKREDERPFFDVVAELDEILDDANARCRADDDGDCGWPECPQVADGEPGRSGRSCPLAHREEGR